MIFGLQNEREWATFCAKVLDRPEIATDPRFRDNNARREHRRELTELIEAHFADMTSIEVVRTLDAAGIANGRLNEAQDVWDHVQFSARDRWREVATPGGPVRATAAADHLHRCRGGDGRRAGARRAHRRGPARTRIRRCGDRGAAHGRSGMSAFDPAAHRMIPEQRWFDDFRLGERFVLPSRTMTEALFLAFQAASGDNHPVHYNIEYCRAHGLPGMLAHGFQTLIQTAPGAGLFPFVTEDSLVGFLEQSSRFLKPVFAGDTLYPTLEVDELSPNRTTGVVGLAQHGAQPAPGAGAGGAAALPAAQTAHLISLSCEAGEGSGGGRPAQCFLTVHGAGPAPHLWAPKLRLFHRFASGPVAVTFAGPRQLPCRSP